MQSDPIASTMPADVLPMALSCEASTNTEDLLEHVRHDMQHTDAEEHGEEPLLASAENANLDKSEKAIDAHVYTSFADLMSSLEEDMRKTRQVEQSRFSTSHRDVMQTLQDQLWKD